MQAGGRVVLLTNMRIEVAVFLGSTASVGLSQSRGSGVERSFEEYSA